MFLLRNFRHYSKPIQSIYYKSGGISNVRLMSVQQQFEEAKIRLNKLSEEPDNEVKLKIYGLFKQATAGPVNTKRPGMTDFVGRAKWDAWSKNGEISKEDAQQKYIELINTLAKEEEEELAAQQASGQTYKTLRIELDGKLRKIILNRPEKFNSLNFDMFTEWVAALQEAQNDPKTVLTAVTGTGTYFTSGNDLTNFMGVTPENVKEFGENFVDQYVKTLMEAHINFAKPLVAVVNGPAVGAGVTLLPFYDAVYSSDRATFHTTFTALGQVPEACSTITFPRMMGYGNASQMLLFNKKIGANEALRLGLVTEVFPDASLQSEIWPRLKEYSNLPEKSLLYSRELMRGVNREDLHKANAREVVMLKKVLQGEELTKSVMAFLQRKKKA